MFKILVGLFLVRMIFMCVSIITFFKLEEIYKRDDFLLRIRFDTYQRLSIRILKFHYVLSVPISVCIIKDYRMLKRDLKTLIDIESEVKSLKAHAKCIYSIL